MTLDLLMVPMPHEYDADELHEMAREHAGMAEALMRRALGLFGLEPTEATEERIGRLTAQSREQWAQAGECLARLNDHCLSIGVEPGAEATVKGHRYRVASPGGPCTLIGVAASAIDAQDPATDPDWSDRDELAERSFEYGQMVKLG